MSNIKLLVVVDDFDMIGSFLRPHKTDPPLSIDANRVLPGAIAAQGFELIPRWVSEIVKCGCGIKHL